MSEHYILEADGKTPKKVEFGEYLDYLKKNGDGWRKVKQTYLANDIKVSTVFLSLDHGHWWYGEKPEGYQPVLWETMIFNAELPEEYGGEYQERYTSYDEAIEGHKKAVAIAATLEPTPLVNPTPLVKKLAEKKKFEDAIAFFQTNQKVHPEPAPPPEFITITITEET